MKEPTPNQIAKLPKWTQDYIAQIERQRDAAVETLNTFQDSQTESPIYFEDYVCTGEKSGPVNKRRYIQSRQLNIVYAGVECRVHLAREDDGQREYGIHVSWSGAKQLFSRVALIPHGFQSIAIVAKENMR